MPYSYDLNSANAAIKDISRVRLHIPDRESPFFFKDEEIAVFLEDNANVSKLAAADALESKATDEAFVQKVQSTLGETTDGAKTADFVVKRAQMLRDQVEKARQTKQKPGGSMSIAPNA
jgi:hypothetical protein